MECVDEADRMRGLGVTSLLDRLTRWWHVFRHGLPSDFDSTIYLRLNPDVKEAKINPIRHFLQHGRSEGRRWRYVVPAGFDPAEYLLLNPDVAAAGLDPARHYAEHGQHEGRRWERELPAGFNPAVYLELNPDVAETRVDPERHYVEHGRKERRRWRRIETPEVMWVVGNLQSEPLLVGAHNECNIVFYKDLYWGVPRGLGKINLKNSDHRRHPEIRSAASKEQLIAMLEETGV